MIPTSSRAIRSSAKIEDALAAHQCGRLAEAESTYRAILAATPRHFDALHLLGVVCTQQGRCEDAAALIGKALTLNPKSMEAHYNLGIALSALGRHRQAVASYRRAAGLDPRHALVQNNLGISLEAMGQREEAIAALRQAIALDPAFADAHFNLGRALAACGRQDNAILSYRAALALKPDYAAAWANTGAALMALARYPDAIECLNAALALQPDSADVLSNLGVALGALAKHEEAIACFEKALKLNPRFAEALNNLGNALKDARRYECAVDSYRQAIAVNPDYVEAMANLGNVLGLLGRYEEAIAQYRRALAIKPDFPEAHSYLLFALDFVPAVGFTELQQERRAWYARHARRFGATVKPHENERDPKRRLRIGYVSADFKRHSVTVTFGSVIRNHDKSRFETVLYSNVKVEDEVTASFRESASLWRPIAPLSDEALADLIREDRIDILVDLSGHTEGNRLLTFARKPAPVQVTGWGAPTGTGIPEIDYLLADPVTIPAEARLLFAETVVDLSCTLGFEAPTYAPAVAPSPSAAGEPFTFGCFNRLSKVSEQAMALWARILIAVPGARLALKDTQLSDEAVRQRLTAAFATLGVPKSRLVLLPGTSHVEHLAAYSRVDVALDPFPATGGVTTMEALWMGVPVVTKIGHHVSGRVPSAILTALGLSDWIAVDEEGYLALAVRKASDRDALAAVRPTLRPAVQASRIGDPVAYCRAVEGVYRTIWERYCQG